MAPPLSDRDKVIRDTFVDEYLFDRDGKAALIRMGFLETFAEEYAKKYLLCSYVQGKLRERESTTTPADEAAKEDQWVLLQLKRLATDPFAKHSTRVQALAHYARLRGMDPAIKMKQDINIEEQVQFYLPDNGR